MERYILTVFLSCIYPNTSPTLLFKGEKAVSRINKALYWVSKDLKDTGHRITERTFPFSLRDLDPEQLELNVNKYQVNGEETQTSKCGPDNGRCQQTNSLKSFSVLMESCLRERYRIGCYTAADKQVIGKVVEVCRTPFVKQCSENSTQPSVCRTLGEEECKTILQEKLVEEDDILCETVQQKWCKDGGRVCGESPTQVCSFNKRTVRRITPVSRCYKVGIRVCSPPDCDYVPGEVVCRDIDQDFYQEVPRKVCRLEARPECVFLDDLRILNPNFSRNRI